MSAILAASNAMRMSRAEPIKFKLKMIFKLNFSHGSLYYAHSNSKTVVVVHKEKDF